MGALAPILYQGAIPVFADVDARTGNVTAASIADRLTDRTAAIVVTHLFGNPRDIEAISGARRAARHPGHRRLRAGVPRPQRGRVVGTVGTIGCFSLQQGKHITTGEGGLVVSDDARPGPAHPALREQGLAVRREPDPDHEFLALNSRMTELQGAVANAQLDKLEAGIAQRIAMADLLTADARGRSGHRAAGRARRTMSRLVEVRGACRLAM